MTSQGLSLPPNAMLYEVEFYVRPCEDCRLPGDVILAVFKRVLVVDVMNAITLAAS